MHHVWYIVAQVQKVASQVAQKPLIRMTEATESETIWRHLVVLRSRPDGWRTLEPEFLLQTNELFISRINRSLAPRSSDRSSEIVCLVHLCQVRAASVVMDVGDVLQAPHDKVAQKLLAFARLQNGIQGSNRATL